MKTFYHRILVPLDGSQHSEMAFGHALGLAECGGAEIVLAHCTGEVPSSIGGGARATIIAACEEDGQKLLAPFKEKCEEAGLKCKVVVRTGSPGRGIVQICKDEMCDIIVMGSRGGSDFSGMVLGSVSHRVLRHSPVPVLIVR